MGIGKNIEAAMLAANLRPVDIARALGITDSAVSQWFRKDKGPRPEKLPELAGILGTTTEDLLRGARRPKTTSDVKKKMQDTPLPATMKDIRQMPETVRIFRTDPAGDGFFIMGEDSGFKARRPSRFEGREDIRAIYVQGDANEDRYRAGQLIYLETLRPPTKSIDDAVLLFKEGGKALLGKLVDRTPDLITIMQYAAKDRLIETPSGLVQIVFRVMTMNDLLG